MSDYSRFNRHDNMNSETLSEIMDIKKCLWMREDVTTDTEVLENLLCGLFDGYLYENLISKSKNIPSDLRNRIKKVYDTCSTYPVVLYKENIKH